MNRRFLGLRTVQYTELQNGPLKNVIQSKNTLGAIIVCRLDSKRLKGKAFRSVGGKPLIWYVLAKCREVKELGDNIIIATSTRQVDDPIEDYAREQNIRLFRGAAKNVAKRVLDCALENKLSHFVRVNADSPFLEPSLIQLAYEIAESSQYDFITNLYPRSFPYGVSLELFKTSVFHSAYKQMSTQDHFEHVTPFFYQHMNLFRYYNIKRQGEDWSKLRMTVDTKEDLQKFIRVEQLAGNEWRSLSYGDVIELYKKSGPKQ